MRKLENGVEATRNALAEGLSVYLTLAKVVARRAQKIRELGNLEISKWVVIKSFFDGSDLSDKLDWFELSEENEKYKK